MSDPSLLYRAKIRGGWGFVLYRQDYSDDFKWATALQKYESYMLTKALRIEYVSDSSEDEDSTENEEDEVLVVGQDNDNAQHNESKQDEEEDEERKLVTADLKRLFKIKVFDRRGQFESKTIDQIREHYLEWFKVWGRLFIDIPPRERVFIIFDAECIKSLVEAPDPLSGRIFSGGFVKTVDAEWNPAERAQYQADWDAKRLRRGYMPPRKDGGVMKLAIESLAHFWHCLCDSRFDE
jgi:hypothetical protein